MVKRLVSIDTSDNQMPDTVREQVAANLTNTEAVEGVALGQRITRDTVAARHRLTARDIPATATLSLAFVAESPASAAAQVIAGGVTWGILDGPFDIIGAPQLASGEMDGGYFRNTLGMTDSDANRAPYQLEWVTDGDTEFRLRAFTGTPRFRLFVDDVPAQGDDPQVLSGITVSSGTNFRIGITHPSAGTLRRFRLQIAQAGVRTGYTAPTSNIYAPRVRRPKVGIIGTSFEAHSGSTALFLDSWVYRFGERFGLDIINCSRSGAGYVADGSNTFAAQVPVVLAQNPDWIVVAGSGNDVSATGTAITDAATAVYQSLAASGIPLVVVGMLPRGAGETAGTAGKVVQFTKAAADAAPNVLGFVDAIGTVDPLPDYTTGAAYAAGARVKYLNTTWQARVAIASAPATLDRTKWSPLSWNIGTGRVGATAGDGNRDVNVQADDLHPTAKGSRMIAANIGPRIAQVIAAA